MPILIPLGKSGVRNTAVDVAAPREGGGGREEEGGGREEGGAAKRTMVVRAPGLPRGI